MRPVRIAAAAVCGALSVLAAPLAGITVSGASAAGVTTECNTNAAPVEYEPNNSAGVTTSQNTVTFGPYGTDPLTAGPVTLLPAQSFGPFSQTVPAETVGNTTPQAGFVFAAVSACAGIPQQVGSTTPVVTGTICYLV